MISDDILSADEMNERRMASASVAFVNALRSGIGPERFLWTNSINGHAWQPSEDPRDYRTTGFHRVLASQADKAATEARRVSRDPCPVCATRADIGCKHRRVA